MTTKLTIAVWRLAGQDLEEPGRLAVAIDRGRRTDGAELIQAREASVHLGRIR